MWVTFTSNILTFLHGKLEIDNLSSIRYKRAIFYINLLPSIFQKKNYLFIFIYLLQRRHFWRNKWVKRLTSDNYALVSFKDAMGLGSLTWLLIHDFSLFGKFVTGWWWPSPDLGLVGFEEKADSQKKNNEELAGQLSWWNNDFYPERMKFLMTNFSQPCPVLPLPLLYNNNNISYRYFMRESVIE